MSFGRYSRFYDSFYATKNYSDEVDFLTRIAGLRTRNSILDLGCGTGGHDLLLSQHGYCVTGVDISKGMIQQAITKRKKAGLSTEFVLGDIRTIRLEKKFDLVISMFAVISYQTTNEDFLATLTTSREHLDPGNLFIFDAWYGPAVLHQLPEKRIKEIDIYGERIQRIAIPEIDYLKNIVTVHFRVIRGSEAQKQEEIKEDHPMRYFFAPEVDLFAKQTGFEINIVCPFLDPSREPGVNDWNVTWVLKAV
jgi:SAM-dependent methyltransferase